MQSQFCSQYLESDSQPICPIDFMQGLDFPENIRKKVYFRSQILERPSIAEYWNIF